MEEVKKKNKRIFYLMLGISILLIGGMSATFAYFGASKSNTGTISGTTNNTNGILTINVARLGLNPSPAPASDGLVPADFGVTPNNMTTTLVNNALTAKCAKNGYTGCHVWKITASTTQTVSTANIRLSLTLPTVVDKNEWSYVVYTGNDSSSSNIVYKGRIIESFPNDVTTLDIHNGGGLTSGSPQVYYVMVYLNNTDSVQNDGVTEGTTNATGRYNGSVTLEAMGGEVRANFLEDAAQYITNLYNNASKSTATVNSITYNLAPSVNLMNDRHASMSVGADAGDIRYYGADPNNYVDIGQIDTKPWEKWDMFKGMFENSQQCYDTANCETNYAMIGQLIGMDFTSAAQCEAAMPSILANAGVSSIDEICGEQPILYRIIGVFDGRLKLVAADPISTTGLSWDTSASGVNNGNGINQWGPSNSYEGADLMRLLNPGYDGESVNNSLYWNSGSGSCYNESQNSTTECDFTYNGLKGKQRNMIDTATWYTGAYDQFSYADAHYTAERGNMGKICTQGTTWCNDTVERTSTWNGKVGLISASDYGYAADLSQCNQTLGNYNETGCTGTDWLKSNKFYWTMSPRAISGNALYVFYVSGGGNLDLGFARYGYAVRPAVYLKSGVSISGGNGSQSNPFVLG